MPPSRTLPAAIGRYRIESLIGKGGMGEVYKAFDPRLNRTVALKTIAPNSDNPTFLERLYREAQACGQLTHPRIVTVYDLGEIEGIVFIAMEYLEGDNLEKAMAQGALLFQQKLQIAVQMLDALHYAHTQGVVHRDIKPSNVHVMRDGNIKLLDFGLARVTGVEGMTMTGQLMGTPAYMSPEQVMGQTVDARTDLFSTGAVIYEMLTRRRAFEGETLSAVMLKVLSDEPRMATFWTNVFPEIGEIVTRAMAKSAADRYATAEEMRDALASFLAASNASIRKAEQDETVVLDGAVARVQALLGAGQLQESRTVLIHSVRELPDAETLRSLLREVDTAIAGPPDAIAPPRASIPDPAPALRAAVAPPPREPAPRPDAPPAGGMSTLRSWWSAALAFAGVAIVALVITLRGLAPARHGEDTVSAAPPSPTQTAKPPLVDDPARNPPPAPQPVQAPGRAPLPTRRSQGTQQADRSRVYIDRSGTDAALIPDLTSELERRGLAIAMSAGSSGIEISARVQLTMRPSPFQQTSALTADFVATVRVRKTGSERQTIQLDGHAMDFGEPAVRAAAYRRAAEQIADAIATAMRD